MTNFDKELEAAAKYHVRESDECEVMDDYSAHEDTFKAGSKWSRQFTVQEVCEWIMGDGEKIVRNHCPANLKRAIEQHFKGRGWE